MNGWKPGDRIIHRDNPELGPGLIVDASARRVSVLFPARGAKLVLAADSEAIAPISFKVGDRATLGEEEDPVVITELLDDEEAKLQDGRTVALEQLWPLPTPDGPLERMIRGEVDTLDSFSLRLDLMRLQTIREADGLGAFLGGRIRIFPHQLYVAERATQADPVRWLLADEVGLGKTVEACLILQKLLHAGRVKRVLVIAPSTLTVQWLGELWRKYHRVFVLIDDQRLQDVAKDYGEDFNPFDAYPLAVISRETLEEEPWLGELAVDSGIDMVIVDEAHHLRRPKGHPGNAAYRAVQPLVSSATHALLLTASPLEDDAFGFFRLLQLLLPGELPEDENLEQRIETKQSLPPATSSTRRKDIGGLPPRKARTTPIPETPDVKARLRFESALQAQPTENALQEKRKLQALKRWLSSWSSYRALVASQGDEALKKVDALKGPDARLRLLAERSKKWKANGDKTLVFVADREGLEEIRQGLSRLAQIRTGVFHEDLSAAQRDIEVAQFRLESGPSMLISTECGGEGRNFEFCTRIVLWDIPWHPAVVEQRIGRLDRIGRTIPTEIVVFRPPAGIGYSLVDIYERVGIFEQPLGGLSRELAGVQQAIETQVLHHGPGLTADEIQSSIDATRAALAAVDSAALQALHQQPFTPELGESILERVPDGLDELTEDVVVAACEQLGLKAEQVRSDGRWSISWSGRAKVESLPGVPGGSSYLGTFSRAHAVMDESIDFFASGHPFIEGLLAWLQDSNLGRTTILRFKGPQMLGLAGFARGEDHLQIAAMDILGNPKPEWEAKLQERPLKCRRLKVEDWQAPKGWEKLLRSTYPALANRLGATPEAFAVLWFEP